MRTNRERERQAVMIKKQKVSNNNEKEKKKKGRALPDVYDLGIYQKVRIRIALFV